MEHTAFRAEEYDAKIRKTLPFYEEFYEQVIDVLDCAGKENVSWLDVGCGTGKMYETARKRISIKEFIFMDQSKKMLTVAKERFQAEKNRFLQMSVLELEDIEKYDVVTAVLVNHYLSEENRRLAVGKCCRALKTGGLFFTFENIAPDSEIGKRLALDRWKYYQMRNGKDREEAENHIKRYGANYFPLKVKAHLELMRECGFQAAELVWMSYMQAGFMGVKL